jgi:hypothetical protein
VAVKLIYQVIVKVFSWLALLARTDSANQTEILVLRHETSNGVSGQAASSRILVFGVGNAVVSSYRVLVCRQW